MSLDKIEIEAKEKLGMSEASNNNIKYVKINMKDIAAGEEVAKVDWKTLLRNNIEEIFNGQKIKW